MKAYFSSFSIITAFICLSTIGACLIPFLNVHLKPIQNESILNVSYNWPDASSKLIEQEVTSKLEGLFNGIEGVKKIESLSKKENGIITIQFKNSSDLEVKRFELASLIRNSYYKLPIGLSYPEISSTLSTNLPPILSYNIKSFESPTNVKNYLEGFVLPRLANIDGVSHVNVHGAGANEWIIKYDIDRLHLLQISLEEVQESVNRFLIDQGLGEGRFTSKKGGQIKYIYVKLTFKSSPSIQWDEVPIKNINGRIIYLDDVADINLEPAKINSYYRINGLSALSMVIYPEKGVNTLKISSRIKEVLGDLENKISKKYEIQLKKDTTIYLVEYLKKIKLRALFSLLILFFLTILFYRDIRYLFILFLSIVVNLLVAVIFFYLFDVQLQLYSFAGITISFGIIIDNSIVMMDHIKNKGNRKSILAIVAATMTTLGALLIIFLLEESQRLNLLDFARIIIITVGVSLFISMYFVPALMNKFIGTRKKNNFPIKRKKRVAYFLKFYERLISFLFKPYLKWSLVLIFILSFGIPLHLLPKKFEGDSLWKNMFNSTIGNELFSSEIRPYLEKIMGGTFRLFTENVFENSYSRAPERTTLRISGAMSDGCTIEQLNSIIQKVENRISLFDEIELFETEITGYDRSLINIYFKEEFEVGSFPYDLKNIIETQLIGLNGLDWTISGVGRGFSNEFGMRSNSRIILEGYNYNQLYRFSELFKEELKMKSNGRVEEVLINSGVKENEVLQELHLDFNPEMIALSGLSSKELYRATKNQLSADYLVPIVNEGEMQQIKLVSNLLGENDIWDLNNTPINIKGRYYKLKQLASIKKKRSGNTIRKINQQFRLVLSYNFLGPLPLAIQFEKTSIKEFSEKLPVGFKVSKDSAIGWNKNDKKQYFYILIIISIIFFTCSILLESLQQSLAIIAMIPFSYIGVFLVFYIFDFNFDQGGYASFILLSGISVNSALYIINEYNSLRKENLDRHPFGLYFKAFNYKATPIILTILSTIAGLIPFVWDGKHEAFWFSFAIGSIGGLLFSLIAIFIYLPLFIIKKL